MSVLRSVIAAVSTLTLAGTVHAAELQPLEGRSLELGSLSGVAYYTIEREGFRVVATLAHGEAGQPVRFVAVLVPGQSVTVSAAGEDGGVPASIEFVRQQDQVLVREATAVN